MRLIAGRIERDAAVQLLNQRRLDALHDLFLAAVLIRSLDFIGDIGGVVLLIVLPAVLGVLRDGVLNHLGEPFAVFPLGADKPCGYLFIILIVHCLPPAVSIFCYLNVECNISFAKGKSLTPSSSSELLNCLGKIEYVPIGNLHLPMLDSSTNCFLFSVEVIDNQQLFDEADSIRLSVGDNFLLYSTCSFSIFQVPFARN